MKSSALLRTIAAFVLLLSLTVKAQPPVPNLLPLQNGYLAATCYSPGVNDFVLGVIDVTGRVSQPVDINWAPPMYHGEYSATPWTVGNLGQVFGLAIDPSGNIFAAASTIYGNGNPGGPGGAGAIYKINGVTGVITNFITTDANPAANTVGTSKIPNTFAGLGNICYDKVNNQMFATNMEDGRIYRISNTGVVLSRFDPFGADGGSSGFAPRGELLWAVGVNNNRVYYSVWWENQGSPINGKANEIWSVALTGTGDFSLGAGANIKEIDMPMYPSGPPLGIGYSHPVSDIAFSADGTKMLLAERTVIDQGAPSPYPYSYYAHSSRLLEYTGATTAWVASSVTKYGVGAYGSQTNSAGGTDYGFDPLYKGRQNVCDSVVWVSGDALHFAAGDFNYGLQGTPTAGGSNTNSVLIDLNNDTLNGDKVRIGDVEVFKNCGQATGENPCNKTDLSAAPTQVPGSNGTCCWNVSFFNNFQPNYFTSIQAQIITPGVSFGSSAAPFGWGNTQLNATTTTWQPNSGGIPIGAHDSLIFCLDIGVATSQQIVFSAIGPNGVVCRDTLTFNCKPPAVVPPCVALTRQKIDCKGINEQGTAIFSYTFSVQNNTIYNMAGVMITPIGGASMSPGSFAFSPLLAPNAISPPLSATITGGTPGGVLCLQVTLHSTNYTQCCTDTICIKLPECKDCCEGFTIRQLTDGVKITYDAYGNVTLNTVLSAGPMPITSMSATIVASAISQSCVGKKPSGSVFADITSASPIPGLSGPTFATPPIPPGFSGEVMWGVTPSGVAVVNTPVTLTMAFPPPPGFSKPPCRDTLRFCVRYRFTDTSCRTCDTLICYRVIRKPVLIPIDISDLRLSTNRGIRGTKEEEESAMLSAEVDERPIASIEMTSATDGKLRIDVPANPPGSDPGDRARIVALEMTASPGVALTLLRDEGSGTSATIVDQVARLKVDIPQGTVKDLTLKYDNFTNQLAFRNTLTLKYITAGDPNDTVVGSVTLYARTPGGMGGDTLVHDADAVQNVKDVRTYALKFTGDNPTDDSIACVMIRVRGNNRILAVGPGLDSMRATLQVYQKSDSSDVRLLPAAPGETEATISSVATGMTLGPVYITVSGTSNDSAVFDYQTRNSRGDIVSRGSVVVVTPLSEVRGDDGDPGGITTINLADCYPNPFNNSTTIGFTLSSPEPNIWLTVSDVSGTEIVRLIDGERRGVGAHEVSFDASSLPSGTYYYTLRTGRETQTRKLTVVK